MFDLEKSISEWRRQMRAAGIKTPVPLDELEGHLRDEVDRQMNAGLSAQCAFNLATQQIGRPLPLKNEFKKIQRNIMTKIALTLIGIFGILFGPGILLPALALHRHLGIWRGDIVWPIVVGALITLAGIGVTVLGFKKRKA